MYNWENSNSKHLHYQYDSKNPTCSSSFLNKFNKSIKTHYPKSHQNEDFFLTTSSTTTTPRNRASSTSTTPRNRASSTSTTPRNRASSTSTTPRNRASSTSTTPRNRASSTTTTTPRNRASSTTAIPDNEKMTSLRRACLVEKWMEKKVHDKAIAKAERDSSSGSTTLLEEFDLQDSLFFSTATTTSSSSSSSEIEYSVFSQPKQKPPRVTCFAPPRPKPIKTRTVDPTFIDHFGEENDEDFMKNRSKAANFYSNLKNLKQPISPGVKLTSFIHSLFTKDGKTKKKSNSCSKHSKTEETPYSTCSSASSFSRSCLNKNNKKFEKDDGSKRTVRFCPVSVIVNDDSQACGYKSLREEKGRNHDTNLLNSKFGSSLSKKYEELKKLNNLERESDKLEQQKKLEEVALDLLSGYWDSKLNKSHDLRSKDKGNDDINHGVNNVKTEVEDEDDDGFSCSSSDLFELDHLSLIGDELPVYETTKINSSNNIM